MPKVGLCACYGNHNYGSMLQALATCEALKSLSIDYELIRYEKDHSASRFLQLLKKTTSMDAWSGLMADARWRLYLSRHPEEAARQSRRAASFDDYGKRRFTELSPVFCGYEELIRGSSRYSAVMVGSDQLWLPSGYSSGYYTLEFALPGIKRISYATSFGISAMPKASFGRAKKFLSSIDHLSVREASGADIVHEVTQGSKEAQWVLDPTMLFDADAWHDIVPDNRIVSEEYILCYFLGTNQHARRMCKALKEETGLSVVMLRDWRYRLEDDEKIDDYDMFSADPDDFVNLIRHARFVLTDSFHGTALSVLHRKHFATFYRDKAGANSRNTRIDSLFSKLSINGCLMQEEDLGHFLGLDLDYSSIDNRLAKWRNESMGFLEDALHGLQ
ncbi:polysaccharide pyruvyl transferase family protein [Adlercreutzia sp. ZJ242]|uniref:polysaccharide pyruvyl transferase family protein n=1 Tax=Adlercreutzia sp. ZJ242 TaxID=2709409 RepID=UPI0013ED6951|nr:polysaccharide pyruvyl transferase family protein [Adlercreutzia sp. ZJ242]